MRILWVVVDLTGPTEGDVVTVTESPETPTPSLAERIDVFLAAPGVSDATSDDLLRAAAAQLRQLDRIKAAAGDPEDIRGLCELGVAEADWVAAEGSDDAVDAAGTMRSMAAHLRRFANALEADDGA